MRSSGRRRIAEINVSEWRSSQGIKVMGDACEGQGILYTLQQSGAVDSIRSHRSRVTEKSWERGVSLPPRYS